MTEIASDAGPSPSATPDAKPAPSPESTMTDRLLDAAGIQIDRLPMLPVIFDRVASACAEQMRAVCPSPTYFSYSHTAQGRIGELLDHYETNAVAAILNVPEWDSQVVIGFERDFIFTMVEVMFGAEGTEPPEENGRTFTNLELKVCHRLAEIVARVLSQAFAIATPASFTVDRLETRMPFAVVGRRNAPASATTFLVQALNRGGEMFLLLPHSALSPIRRALASNAPSEPSQRDEGWSKKMQAGVTRAEILLRAILDEKEITLDDVARLRPGQLIALSANPRTPVKLEANDQPLFWCQLGQSDGTYKLRIDTVFDPEQEFLGDLLNR